MVIAIHQPNYLPWLGYFYKMTKVDKFVVLDNVQFTKNSIQNRNKIKSAQGELTLTVPVLTKDKFMQATNEVLANNRVEWKSQHWKSIYQNYSKAKFFKEYSDGFAKIYEKNWDKLADVSEALIRHIAQLLDLKIEIVKASDLSVDGKSTDLLIDICKKMNADEYLSGRGGKKYMDEEKFKAENINLVYYDFKHPVYEQLYGEFLPNLAAIDLLFNCGEKSREILERSC